MLIILSYSMTQWTKLVQSYKVLQIYMKQNRNDSSVFEPYRDKLTHARDHSHINQVLSWSTVNTCIITIAEKKFKQRKKEMARLSISAVH